MGDTVTVVASERRSQVANRRVAEERLVRVLEEALKPPPPRRVKTKPSASSQRRRVQQKRQRGETKRLRGRPDE